MTHQVFDNVTGLMVTREFTEISHALSMCREFNNRPGAGGRYKITNCTFDEQQLKYVAKAGATA